MGGVRHLRIGRPLIASLIAALLVCAVAAPAFAADRWVFSGAVISTRGPSSARAVVRQGLTSVTPRDISAQKIDTRTVFIKGRSRTVNALGTRSEKPQTYSRKTNYCKRAKVRRMLAKIGRVRCEPNFAYFATATPNDTFYSLQYAKDFLQLPAAWDRSTGSSNLVAVVIDSGVLYTHPDLAPNIWTNPNEVAGNGIDDDSNGYIDDIHGINAILDSGDPLDDNGHGTHCAGIMAAKGNNSAGIAGVAWTAKIVGAKFLNEFGSGSLANALKAINYSTTLRQAGHNVVVSNNSWGGGGYSVTLETAIQNAGAAGILFVAAAGNANTDIDTSPTYPASYANPDFADNPVDSIVVVASTTSAGVRSGFSNYGANSVHIAAPGSNIPSTYLDDDYVYLSGTSMAAPQVSGVALLTQAICGGSLTYTQVKDTILSSGTAYESLNGFVLNSKMANANGATQAAQALCPSTTTPTPTSTATPTATATATPAAPTATPTTAPIPTGIGQLTPNPGNEPDGPTVRFSLELSPQTDLTPGASVSTSINHAGRARAALISLRARDTNKRSYSCGTTTLTLLNGSASFSWELPRAAEYFKTFEMTAATSSKRARKALYMDNPKTVKDGKVGRRRILSVCAQLRGAVKRASAENRAKLSR